MLVQTFTSSIQTGLFPVVAKILLILVPLAMPFILLYVFWILRLRAIQLRYISEKKPGLLEIKLPKEIVKSPAGMEIFFSYLNPGGAGTWGEAFLDGKTRPWFSCELVSIEGEVKFFIWMSEGDKFKNLIENQLYAQYPNIEIYEVKPEDDYINNFHFNKEAVALHGVQFKFTQKTDVYPIKTYVDYGLTGNEKEEYKIDPITHVIEFLGSLRAGENAWIQIMFRKHEKEGWKHGVLKAERDLKAEIKKEIEAVKKEAMPAGGDEKTIKFPQMTKGQELKIAALERNADKTPFDTMIRAVYIAKKENFNKNNIGGMMGCLKQYGSNNLNGFKPGFSTDISDAQKDLQRVFPFLKKHYEEKVARFKSSILHAYKLRSFFEWPYRYYKGKPYVMTTEELATLFHFPSHIVSQTPTLKRVPSKKSEAPSNLPI
jgi:hypothetical protein